VSGATAATKNQLIDEITWIVLVVYGYTSTKQVKLICSQVGDATVMYILFVIGILTVPFTQVTSRNFRC